jgi:formylmethanofuran dehydrogenase subunit E-like metal-binding protein
VNFGSDPVHGERDQPHAIIRIEALHGLHETDIAFLDEVTQRQTVARVALGNVHYETQVRHDELTRGIDVALIVKAGGQCVFVHLAQNRDSAYGMDVVIEATDRSGQHNVSTQSGNCSCHSVSTRQFRVLTVPKVPSCRNHYNF